MEQKPADSSDLNSSDLRTAEQGKPLAGVSSLGLTPEMGKKLPNLLTLLRILAVPLFVFLLIDPSPSTRLWATSIFVFASVTDWLDGYLARLYQAESILGTMLDPLADKILVMAALVMLAAIPDAIQGHPKVPAWIVVCLLAREFVVTGLRSLAAVQGVVVPASKLAKYKTASTMLAIFCLLLDEVYPVFGLEINFYQVGTISLWISLLLSLWSGVEYGRLLRKYTL